MGTPRKQRRKYARPKHPWNMERITEEKELCVKYGLKNKTELWRAKTELGRIRTQAKSLLAATGEEAELETKQLIEGLSRIGIKISGVDDALGLEVSNLLERRLQSMVFRKGLANTPKQARQFIVHNHVYVGNHRVTAPGYMVHAKEEDIIHLCDKMKVTA